MYVYVYVCMYVYIICINMERERERKRERERERPPRRVSRERSQSHCLAFSIDHRSVTLAVSSPSTNSLTYGEWHKESARACTHVCKQGSNREARERGWERKRERERETNCEWVRKSEKEREREAKMKSACSLETQNKTVCLRMCLWVRVRDRAEACTMSWRSADMQTHGHGQMVFITEERKK